MAKIKHGHTRSGGYLSPTYISWTSLKQRCLNKKHIRYKNYGGRGITVCKEWKDSFENFLEDMGERPELTSIDRINNNKGYNKGNCKWSTRKQQQNNIGSPIKKSETDFFWRNNPWVTEKEKESLERKLIDE